MSRKNKVETIAYWISFVGHPLFTISAFVLVYGFLFFDVKNAITSFLFILFAVIIPISVNNYWQSKKGMITNFDVSDRKQRASLYPYLLLLMAIVSGIMCKLNFPDKITLGVVYFFLMLVAITLINLRLKASLHAAGSFFICMMIFEINPVVGIAAILFSIIVSWSRIVLKMHTKSEVIAGVVLGIIFGLLG